MEKAFPDAMLFPKIGLPSNNGFLLLTHTDGSGNLLKINGLSSKSPLSNNAFYSAECSNGQYLNLYTIMIPDIPVKILLLKFISNFLMNLDYTSMVFILIGLEVISSKLIEK